MAAGSSPFPFDLTLPPLLVDPVPLNFAGLRGGGDLVLPLPLHLAAVEDHLLQFLNAPGHILGLGSVDLAGHD